MNGRIDAAWVLAEESLLGRGQEPPLASHLVTARAFYDHHGIYVGNGHVIHYGGFALGLRRRAVEDVSLEQFAHGRSIRVRHETCRFDRDDVVARARSRLGERSYRLLTNNCEHFCEWCLNSTSRSSQVERWVAAPLHLLRTLVSTLSMGIDRYQRAIRAQLPVCSDRSRVNQRCEP